MTLGEPHTHEPGHEEIWAAIEGTSLAMLGAQLRVQRPGMAFMLRPDDTMLHSNINYGDTPVKFLWFSGSRKRTHAPPQLPRRQWLLERSEDLTMHRQGYFVFAAALVTANGWSICSAAADPNESLVYFGTYTNAKAPRQSKGIYVARFRSDTGDVTEPVLAAETDNPSFLVVDPTRRFLYSTNETSADSAVSAFSINRTTGKLTLLNRSSSGGKGPCHVAVDKTGKFLFVANFTSSTAAVIRIKADGSLGEQAAVVQQTGTSVNKQWQSEPHAHWVGFRPTITSRLSSIWETTSFFVYRFNQETGCAQPRQPCIGKAERGRWPSQSHVSSEWQVRLPAQPAQRGSKCLSMEHEQRRVNQGSGSQRMAPTQERRGGLQCRGSSGGADRKIPLRVQSRIGHGRRVLRRSGEGNPDADPAGKLARPVSTAHLARPDGVVSTGLERI